MAEDTERTPNQNNDAEKREKGERAERVANWYFRLNGFLSIPGFIVHPDVVQRLPLTEADLIAVRFPHRREVIAGREMVDDQRLVGLAAPNQVLFLLVEVKSGLCKINGPWSKRQHGNMQRVVRRIGFADDRYVEQIALAMYTELRWGDRENVLQYVAIGSQTNDGLGRKYPRLVQITWDDVAAFMFDRFQRFPEKLPENGKSVHNQWPDFGKQFGQEFPQMNTVEDARQFIHSYIEGSPTDQRVIADTTLPPRRLQ